GLGRWTFKEYYFLTWRIFVMAKAKTAKKRESLVVASKIKAYIKGKKMMTSSDAVEAISDVVYSLLDKAAVRTKANRRSTVKPQDL
ncbi:MAG TPA: hypothetical protein VMW23_06115, partial [Sedimentisphaerales bacterium]|nr:hypothetical protein [Sedimentisphaerales bacterium]